MTILCGFDFSESSVDALQTAAAMAGRRGERLLLIHVVQPVPSDPAENHGEIVRGACTEELAKLAVQHCRGVTLETAVVTGSPAASILAHAPDDTTLIVVGGRGQSPAAHWLIGSVAERLARTSPYPLLIIRRGHVIRTWLHGEKPLEVMIATDLTPVADYALERSSLLAGFGPCNVELTYIEYPPAEHARLGIPDPIRRSANPLIENYLRPELQRRVDRVNLGGTVRTNMVLTFGSTSQRIADVAEDENTDLIIAGTHQRKGLDRLWHESVAHGVLHGVDTNVLCIPFHSTGEELRALEVPRAGTIITATDFSPCGNRAVAWAISIAKSDARVLILHVVPREEELAAAAKQLESLRSDSWPPDLTIERHVVAGAEVSLEILQAAARMNAGMIVVGHHGHSRMSLLLGSTAGDLLARSMQPVLVVNDIG